MTCVTEQDEAKDFSKGLKMAVISWETSQGRPRQGITTINCQLSLVRMVCYGRRSVAMKLGSFFRIVVL